MTRPPDSLDGTPLTRLNTNHKPRHVWTRMDTYEKPISVRKTHTKPTHKTHTRYREITTAATTHKDRVDSNVAVDTDKQDVIARHVRVGDDRFDYEQPTVHCIDSERRHKVFAFSSERPVQRWYAHMVVDRPVLRDHTGGRGVFFFRCHYRQRFSVRLARRAKSPAFARRGRRYDSSLHDPDAQQARTELPVFAHRIGLGLCQLHQQTCRTDRSMWVKVVR